jgi:hypothetical protein
MVGKAWRRFWRATPPEVALALIDRVDACIAAAAKNAAIAVSCNRYQDAEALQADAVAELRPLFDRHLVLADALPALALALRKGVFPDRPSAEDLAEARRRIG